jgi:C4-dicarboxylate-binding protein DctP
MLGRLFCVLAISLLVSAHHAAAQNVKLKANLQFPLANPTFGTGLVRLKEEVERQTGGAVVIEIFDRSQLFHDYQVVDAVASGAVDLGMTAAQQFSYKAPVAGILDQPFLFNFQALMDAAARPGSEIRKLIDDAILAQIGVRVLWWQSLGNTVFFSRGDVADPERLRGRRVAAPGRLPGEFVAWCGGTPVALTFEKFPEGFKTGALDMAVAGFGALQLLWQFTDTVTFTAHTPIEFLLVINEARWQSLSPVHRNAIGEAARKVESELGVLRERSEAAARAVAASKNVKLKQVTPDQVADWRACSAGMLADFMERNGELARRLMTAYGKLRTDPCCSAVAGDFTRR